MGGYARAGKNELNRYSIKYMKKSQGKVSIGRLRQKVKRLQVSVINLPSIRHTLDSAQLTLEHATQNIDLTINRQMRLQKLICEDMSQIQLSNKRITRNIERCIQKINRIDEFDKRLTRIEKIVLK